MMYCYGLFYFLNRIIRDFEFLRYYSLHYLFFYKEKKRGKRIKSYSNAKDILCKIEE